MTTQGAAVLCSSILGTAVVIAAVLLRADHKLPVTGSALADPRQDPPRPALPDAGLDSVLERMNRLERSVDALRTESGPRAPTPAEFAPTGAAESDLPTRVRAWGDRIAAALTAAREHLREAESALDQPLPANPTNAQSRARIYYERMGAALRRDIEGLDRAADALTRVATEESWAAWRAEHREVTKDLSPAGD